MKKVIKLFVLLTTVFIGVNVVNADRNCDDLIMYAQSDFFGKTGVYMKYAGITYNFSKFTLKDINGLEYSSYCRNAGISAGKSYDGEKFKCKQVVFDTTTSNEIRKTYDAGIVEILKKGYSTRNNNSIVLEKNQEYAATNLALRVYEMLWPDINTNGSNNTALNKAHKYYANMWLDDAEIKSLLKQSAGTVREKYSTVSKVDSWTLVDSGVNVSAAIEEEAKRLIKLGLKAAVNYKKNGAASLTWNDKPVKLKSPTIADSNGVTKYETALSYVFTAKSFTSEDAYIKMEFSCPECASYGIDYKVYYNLEESESGVSDNLLPENGNGKITAKIVFTSDSTKYEYGEVPYTLNVEFYDESISTEAYDMYSSGCYSNTSCQHFYMLFADDVAQEANIKGTIELNTINCTELEDLCVNEKDLHACELWEDLYNKKCAACQAYVTNASCSDTDSNISVNEGYDYDSTSCTASSTANVLQCIIGQSDQNGNTYQATNLVSNKYCSIWCKEDYHFTLPGNKKTNSGRYFTLQAAIKGTKTCYTTEIKKTVFENDYKAAQEEIVKAYNNWALHNAAINNHGNNLITTNPQAGAVHKAHSTTCTCSGTDGKIAGECGESAEHKPHKIVKKCSGIVISTVDGDKYSECGKTIEHKAHNYFVMCSGSDGKETAECGKTTHHIGHNYVCATCDGNKAADYYNYKYSFSFYAYDPDGTVISSLANLEYDTTTTTCSIASYSTGLVKCTYQSSGGSTCTHDSCSSYNGKDITETYTAEDLESKASVLNSKISATDKVLKNYNNCSSWTMSYNFKPEIHFWYEESYMNSVNTNILATDGNIKKTPTSVQRCSSNVTDQAYEECPTGWTTNSLLKDESKFLCYADGTSYKCGTKTIKVAQTVRMKETIGAEGAYITPTQFYTIYPSGAIAVASPGIEIDNAKELTNKLPIGLGTKQGVYNYTLVVEKLGEYYNSGKLGRIWGDDDSVVSTTLKENSKCYPDGALKYELNIDGKISFDGGVYNCAYTVNCPDCPIDCDPVCENPDCPDNDCPIDCDDCIYTNNNTDVDYRPITPDDINPNDRELGKNWEFDLTGLGLKAYTTIKEIEEFGESIYDVDFENPSDDAEFAMKVTLDGKMISKIRAYNDRYEDTYGYLNNSLKCYDYKNSLDGKTYANIFCYSELIDELLTDEDTKDNIKITVERPLSEKDRKDYNPSDGYFTTWSLADTSEWKITTSQGLTLYQYKYFKTDYGRNNIGPSWK